MKRIIFALFGGVSLCVSGITSKLFINRENRHFILDIDHTLIHSINANDNFMLRKLSEPTYLIRDSPNISKDYDIYARRWLDITLKSLNFMGNVHAYTMGTDEYANEIINKIDPDRNIFKMVLSRNDCTTIGKRKNVKNLDTCLERMNMNKTFENKKKMILIDDNIRSFVVEQEPMGIQIKRFDVNYTGQDNSLLKLVIIIAYRILINSDDLSSNKLTKIY